MTYRSVANKGHLRAPRAAPGCGLPSGHNGANRYEWTDAVTENPNTPPDPNVGQPPGGPVDRPTTSAQPSGGAQAAAESAQPAGDAAKAGSVEPTAPAVPTEPTVPTVPTAAPATPGGSAASAGSTEYGQAAAD